MKSLFAVLLLLCITVYTLQAQQQARVGCIGFYNFENLFDTLDQVDKLDEDFTPEGALQWTAQTYGKKIENLAKVVSELGVSVTPDGPALLGVAEIENSRVLEDFVQHPSLAKRNYQIVHYESPDVRGIDVALLYQPKYFTPFESRPVPVQIYDANGERILTRDILFVGGIFDQDTLYVMVNHWPSRRGGAQASQPYRNAAAMQCKMISDSLRMINPEANILIMGDLNDDPVSPSVKQILRAQKKVRKVKTGDFYNPWHDFYKKGIGTLAYQDAWNLFDQILLSAGLVGEEPGGYTFFQAEIYNPAYLVQKTGRFKGYPFRTFAGGAYLGGYSDHFPVCVYLIKMLE